MAGEELLGAAVLELAVDPRGLEAGMAAAEARVRRAGGGMQRTLDTRMRSMGGSLTSFGKSWNHHVALPIVGLGALAGKMSLDFHHAMEQVSEQAGASAKEVANLTGEVEKLAKQSIFSPKELADALFHIESVGFRGAKAMHVLNAAQKLATVGNSDLEATTYALVSAQETGIKGTEKLGKTIGTLNAIVGRGDMRMEDLTASLSSGVLVAAKSVGLSLRDVGAALDVMTARGMPAEESATRLRMTFSLLAAPTDRAQKVLKSIGLEATDLAKAMRRDGLAAAVQLLHDRLEGLSKVDANRVIAEAFGGGRSSAGIMTLVQNVGDLHERVAGIAKSTGEFKAKLREAENEPLNKLEAAWSSVQVSLIKIGDELIPTVVPGLTDAANAAGGIGEAFAKMPKPMRTAVVDAALIAASLGLAARATGAIFKGLGMIAGTKLATGLAGAASRSTLGTAAGVYALNFAGELKTALPYAIAAAGVGNVVASAIHGDSEKAATKAGGLVAGALAGGLVAGLPGAMVGAGIGSALSGVLDDVLGGHGGDWLKDPMGALAKRAVGSFATSFAREAGSEIAAALDRGELPARAALRQLAALKRLDDALVDTGHAYRQMSEAQRNALHGLSSSAHEVDLARRRQRTATNNARHAEAALQVAYARYPAKSVPVLRALADVTEAKERERRATHALQRAERLHGVELAATKVILRESVVAQRERLTALGVEHQKIVRKLRDDVAVGASAKVLNRDEKALNRNRRELRSTTAALAATIAKASQQIGPRFAGYLKKSQTSVLEFGRQAKITAATIRHPFENTIFNLNQTVDMSGGKFFKLAKRVNAFGLAFPAAHRRAKPAIDQMDRNFADFTASVYAGELTTVTNLNRGLGAFGAKPLRFTLEKPKQRRRAGGMVVPGTGTGDKVHLQAMVEPGERVFVLNRNASRELERLQALNAAVPRFQGGGWMSGLQPGIISATSALLQRFPGLYVTSGYRTSMPIGHPDFHNTGQATDTAGPAALMYQAAQWAGGALGRSLAEGIHNPNLSIKNGAAVSPGFWGAATWAGHARHIHMAVLGALAGLVGQDLARVILRGQAPLRTLGQANLDRFRSGAQGYLTRNMPTMAGGIEGGSGPWQQVMAQIADSRGWSLADWQWIVAHESGGNPAARNRSSGAFGLGQFLGSTGRAYAKYGALSSDPVEQIQAMGMYIADRYGNPTAAKSFWERNHWYARGGLLGGYAAGGLLDWSKRLRLPGYRQARRAKQRRARRATAKIRGLGLGAGLEELIAGLEGSRDELAQNAENASSLDSSVTRTLPDGTTQEIPVSGRFRDHTAAFWLSGSEDPSRPGSGGELCALLRLRNAYIQAETRFDALIRRARSERRYAERRLRQLRETLRKLRRRLHDLDRQLKRATERRERLLHELHKKHLKPARRRALQADYVAVSGELFGTAGRPGLISQRQHASSAAGITQAAIDGQGRIITALGEKIPALTDARESTAASLSDVQGLGSPTRILRRLPPFGELGGQIFQVQSTLRAIGQAASPQDQGQPASPAPAPESTEGPATPLSAGQLADLLAQMFNTANAQRLVAASQLPILQGLLPKYHTGGILDGGPIGSERAYLGRVGEGIFTPEQMAAMAPAGDGFDVEVRYPDGAEAFLRKLIDVRIVKRDRDAQAKYRAGKLR